MLKLKTMNSMRFIIDDIGTPVPAIEIKINGQIGKKNKANSRFICEIVRTKWKREYNKTMSMIHNSFSMHSYDKKKNIEIESNI